MPGGLLRFRNALATTSSGGSEGPHDYFTLLQSYPEYWSAGSASLRDDTKLTTHHSAGGWADSINATIGFWGRYLPSSDTDPQAQDACKVTIPTWYNGFNGVDAVLTQSIDSSQLSFTMNPNAGAGTPAYNVPGGWIKIDDEVMQISSWNGTTMVVSARAQKGTTAAAHTIGTGVYRNCNSLQNLIRVPLGTSDGNTYLFTWDEFRTDAWLPAYSNIDHQKSYQFVSGANNPSGLWLEPGVNYAKNLGTSYLCTSDKLAGLTLRGYNLQGGSATWTNADQNKFGPGVVLSSPSGPIEMPAVPQPYAQFCVVAGRWWRWWFVIEQNANDYDYMSMYCADETQSAVQIYDRVPLSVRTTGTPNQIHFWYIELQTSADTKYHSLDLVAYVRNFWSGVSSGTQASGGFSTANLASRFLHKKPVAG